MTTTFTAPDLIILVVLMAPVLIFGLRPIITTSFPVLRLSYSIIVFIFSLIVTLMIPWWVPFFSNDEVNYNSAGGQHPSDPIDWYLWIAYSIGVGFMVLALICLYWAIKELTKKS